VLHLDTESDFWQARSSLVVTDTSGADIAIPEEVRVYTVSGEAQMRVGSAGWAAVAVPLGP
jgi:hypothetical protein